MRNRLRLCYTAIVLLSTSRPSLAQIEDRTAEPAIPVYMVCPFHEDSLRNLYGNALYNAGPPFIALAAKSDSLSRRVLASEDVINAAWNRRLGVVYALVGALVVLNVLTLRTTQRLRHELAAQRSTAGPAIGISPQEKTVLRRKRKSGPRQRVGGGKRS